MIDMVVIPVFKMLVVITAVLSAVAYMVLLERKVQAWVQVRLGPMRVGPHGILQPIADVVKLITKEDVRPASADPFLFTLAPILVVVPALIVFAVVPFGTSTTMFGKEISLYITDLDIGLLYIVSVASIGLYGLILGGWASNSKYPLLSSLRASAQIVSYEVAVTMTLVSLIVTAGSLSLVEIVKAQEAHGVWYVFIQPVAFVIFVIGALAETNRAPFDLPEAEQELVGGFHTEYSGMRFALFFLAEYTNMIVVSAVGVTMFLGGWLAPFSGVSWLAWLGVVPGGVGFSLKTFLLLSLFLWIRATLPRYRYDQLMRLGWKVLIPLALANLAVSAVVKVLL